MDLPEQVAEVIISSLDLSGFTPQTFPKEAILFAPEQAGGLGLDSIASLEIIAGLSDRFNLPFDDIKREDMMSALTLSAYIRRKQAGEAG